MCGKLLIQYNYTKDYCFKQDKQLNFHINIYICGYTRIRSFATLLLVLRQVDGGFEISRDAGSRRLLLLLAAAGIAIAADAAVHTVTIDGSDIAKQIGVSGQTGHTAVEDGRIISTIISICTKRTL